MNHIASVFGEREANHVGNEDFDPKTFPWAGSAADVKELLATQYTRWCDGALGEEGLGRPCGPHEGPFHEEPFAALVLHIYREYIHHAAEIRLLRDLFRDTLPDRRSTPWVDCLRRCVLS